MKIKSNGICLATGAVEDSQTDILPGGGDVVEWMAVSRGAAGAGATTTRMADVCAEPSLGPN